MTLVAYRSFLASSVTHQFVAHPNVQQLLASIWYEGLPGFRQKNMVLQSLDVIRIGLLFPLFSIFYILAPHSRAGKTMRKPFIKFICHSASYFSFLSKCVPLVTFFSFSIKFFSSFLWILHLYLSFLLNKNGLSYILYL